MATLAASAVLILAAAVVSAGAQRPTADRGQHLLLVPDEDKPALALQKSGARSLDPLVENGPLVSKGERPDGPGLAVVQ